MRTPTRKRPSGLHVLRVKPQGTTYQPKWYDYSNNHGVGTATAHLYRPIGERADLVTADEHSEACRKLDLTHAGRMARKLLFSHLSRDQLRQVERENMFEIHLIHPAWRDEFELSQANRRPKNIERGYRGFHFPTIAFRIWRGFPNGNVQMWIPDDTLPGNVIRGDFVTYNLCLHPTAPYPTDDICLSQKLLLESDAEEFLRLANVTYANELLRAFPAPRWTRMWGDAPETKKEIEIPFSRELIERQRARRKRFQPTRERDVLDSIDTVMEALAV